VAGDAAGERDVGQAARGVDLELLAQTPEQREHLAAGVAERADRHDQWSTTTSCARDAEIGAALHDLLGDGERTSGSIEMPVSSLEMANHRHVVFLISGRSLRASLPRPVTEFTSGRPLATFNAASIAAVTEPVDRQRQVDQVLHDLQRLHEQARLGALGSTAVTPALTSSCLAPQAALLPARP